MFYYTPTAQREKEFFSSSSLQTRMIGGLITILLLLGLNNVFAQTYKVITETTYGSNTDSIFTKLESFGKNVNTYNNKSLLISQVRYFNYVIDITKKDSILSDWIDSFYYDSLNNLIYQPHYILHHDTGSVAKAPDTIFYKAYKYICSYGSHFFSQKNYFLDVNRKQSPLNWVYKYLNTANNDSIVIRGDEDIIFNKIKSKVFYYYTNKNTDSILNYIYNNTTKDTTLFKEYFHYTGTDTVIYTQSSLKKIYVYNKNNDLVYLKVNSLTSTPSERRIAYDIDNKILSDKIYNIDTANNKVHLYLSYNFTYKPNGNLWVKWLKAYNTKDELANANATVYDYQTYTPVEEKKAVANHDFSIYPNPAKDIITMHLPDNIDRIFIINTNGQVLYYIANRKEKERQVNLQNLPKGVYTVKLYNKQECLYYYKKVVTY